MHDSSDLICLSKADAIIDNAANSLSSREISSAPMKLKMILASYGSVSPFLIPSIPILFTEDATYNGIVGSMLSLQAMAQGLVVEEERIGFDLMNIGNSELIKSIIGEAKGDAIKSMKTVGSGKPEIVKKLLNYDPTFANSISPKRFETNDGSLVPVIVNTFISMGKTSGILVIANKRLLWESSPGLARNHDIRRLVRSSISLTGASSNSSKPNMADISPSKTDFARTVKAISSRMNMTSYSSFSGVSGKSIYVDTVRKIFRTSPCSADNKNL